MTIRTRTLIWLLLPSILIATIVATFYFYHTQRTIKQNVFDNLEIAASEAKEHVLLFLKEKSGRTLDFSSDGFIRDCTEEITGKESRKEYYTTLLNNHLVTNKKPLDSNIIEVFVVDFEGKVIASTEKSNIGKDISGESYFTNVEYLSAFASVPHYSEHSEAIIIDFSTVLLSKIGKEAIGIIVNRIRIGQEGEQNQDITTIQQDGKPGNTKLVYANKVRIMDFGSDGFIRDCAEELTKREDREVYYTGILNTHLFMNKRPLDPEIISVFVTDLNGTIIGSSEFGLLGKDVSERPYFQKAVKRGSFISGPHRNPGFEHSIIEISRLLTSKNEHKPIGIIVNRYRGDGLNGITRSGILDESGTDMLLKGFGDTGEVYVVNGDKVMVTESRFIKDAPFNQVVDTKGVNAAFNNGKGMIGIYADYRGVPILGVSKYIEEMDWVVLAEKDVSEAFAPITHLRNFTIITGIVSIIIIVAIAIFLATGITMPIRKLVKGTEKIANGDLSYRIDSKSNDEIGYLASSFNNMTASLEEAKKQLQDYADHLEEKVEEKTEDILVKSRQQNVVAQIGKLLWTNLDMDKIMDRVVVLTSKTLKVELCKILLLDESGKHLHLAAGVGWKEGLVGHATVGIGHDSQAGYTIKGQTPVVVKDLKTEMRFSGPPLLVEHGVVSGLSVPMIEGNNTIGVMGVHTTKTREFSKVDIDFLQSIGHFMAAFINRTQSEKKIKTSLNEKEVLLMEVHHRVKNNMQVVSSLLNLQAARIEDKRLLDIFKESQDRIKSMSRVHEELYGTKDLSNVKFDKYVRKLTDGLMESYVIYPNSISLILNIDNVYLGIDAAIPCGLIINELFTNSLKYAFPALTKQWLMGNLLEGSGKTEISINFYIENKTHILLFSDNGVGLPEDLDIKNINTLGLDLVNTLTQQLGGTIEINRTGGTQFKIMFKV